MMANQKRPDKNTGQKITGAQVLAELSLPAYAHIPFVKCSYNSFSKGFSKLVDYYVLSASGSAKGEAGFAIRFLFARSINDLVAGFHLATHGFVIQSHSVLRSIFESLDKIELFSDEPKYAELWVKDPEKARKELTPSGVRKILKVDKADVYTKMYGFFCEIGSHPTFISSRTMSYAQKQNGKRPKIIVKIGPTDLVHPILFILVFCFLLMMSISLSLAKHLKANKETEKLLLFQFKEMDYFLANCVKPTYIKYEGKLPPEFKEILAISEKQKEYINSIKNENQSSAQTS